MTAPTQGTAEIPATTIWGVPAAPAPAGFIVNPALLTGDDDPALPDGADPADAGGALPAGVFWVGAELPAGRLELFRVNGRVYTVPAAADPRIVFRMLRAMRKGDQDRAMADMLYDVLGEPVVDALADEEGLDAAQLGQIMQAIQKYTMSAMKRAGLGN